MFFRTDIVAYQCLHLISFIGKINTQFYSRAYQHPTQIHNTIYPHIRLLYNSWSVGYQIIQRGRIYRIRSLYVHISIQRRTIESNRTSILDHKILANDFLQAELIYPLCNSIITKHLHITFIIEFRSDISCTFSTDIVSGNRIHDNPHSSVRRCIYQNIQANIRLLFLCLRLTFLLYLVIVRDDLNRILNSATGCFVHKLNKLITGGWCYTTINIGEDCIPVGGHSGINFQSLHCISGK